MAVQHIRKILHDLVIEGLNNKLLKMPEDAQIKLRETLKESLTKATAVSYASSCKTSGVKPSFNRILIINPEPML